MATPRFLRVDNETLVAMDAIRVVEFFPAVKAGVDEDGVKNSPRAARLVIWTDALVADGVREDGLDAAGSSKTIVRTGPLAQNLFNTLWHQ